MDTRYELSLKVGKGNRCVEIFFTKLSTSFSFPAMSLNFSHSHLITMKECVQVSQRKWGWSLYKNSSSFCSSVSFDVQTVLHFSFNENLAVHGQGNVLSA